jgi:hypothetical protein
LVSLFFRLFLRLFLGPFFSLCFAYFRMPRVHHIDCIKVEI